MHPLDVWSWSCGLQPRWVCSRMCLLRRVRITKEAYGINKGCLLYIVCTWGLYRCQLQCSAAHTRAEELQEVVPRMWWVCGDITGLLPDFDLHKSWAESKSAPVTVRCSLIYQSKWLILILQTLPLTADWHIWWAIIVCFCCCSLRL